MNNKISFFLSKFNLVVGLAVLLIALPLTGVAQQTTSSVRGTLTGPDGGPAAGVTVSVTDDRTTNRRGTTTSASGQFSVSGLKVGGPYRVQISSSAYASQTITDV